MAEKFQAWKASDGSIHATEAAAKDREFYNALDAWMRNQFEVGPTAPFPTNASVSFMFMNENRYALLPIFKLLNGGNAAPPAIPPSREEMSRKAQSIVR